MTLCFDLDRILVLKNVLYVSVVKQNLILVFKLIDHGYSVSFRTSVIMETLFVLETCMVTYFI
jgi:hypothetical protein